MKNPIDYTIEPAKGQALLNFQGRRLPDKIDLFETTLIEEVRQKEQTSLAFEEGQSVKQDTELNADFRNLLIHGDCLSACDYLKSKNIKVDLVYIDPPFASGANYAKKIYLRTGNGKSAFENTTKEIGEEIMYGDIWQKEDYLNWLYERLLAIRDVMSDTASIYVYLDWHIGAYAKILLDEVFGEENFINEIIWHYTSSKSPNVRYARKHDNIYHYSKTEKYYFKQELKRASDFSKSKYDLEDERGIYKMVRGYRKYFKEEVPIDDIWDIPLENVQSKEIQNYTTQKPTKLLERVIETASGKGMIVADFFSGSGVTAKVANNLGRKFITCDIGINAIQTTRDRLAKAK
ncbi:MAG: site-specific DNA-methyltransferase, partial [Bacteroidota bacterium]